MATRIRETATATVVVATVLAGAARAACAERESKAPSAKSTGSVYAWKSASGSPFEYYVPKSYDAALGANLVAVLHGNGLSYEWTFANHPAGEFRPDDIVVSLEGTQFLQSTGAHEFMAGRESCQKVHEILDELKKAWKVRQTFLYGHSQGSFFVFEYAGEFPKDVDGVVGHAGALWGSSKLAKGNHHQAIAFLHGTEDANVRWFQSVDGRKAYRDADYPLVHLRTLWGWPHAPHWQQAQYQLAWCEGMTSQDPARVASALETLARKPGSCGLDPAALFAVAQRLEGMACATAAQKSAGAKARAAVDKVAKSIVAAIDGSLGKEKLTKVSAKPWHGLALRFLEDFDGVAACNAWAKSKAADLAAIDKVATASGREFWDAAQRDPAKALAAGLELLEKGWRNPGAVSVATQIEEWLGNEKFLELSKKEAQRVRTLVDNWKKGRNEGLEACEKLLKDLDP